MSYKWISIVLMWPLCAASTELPAIRVGMPAALSGASAAMGLSMRNGIRLAVADINREGGVHGRLIELVERDDGGAPERGVRVARQLIAQDKVTAVVGFVNSPVALLAQTEYQQAGIPMMMAGATAETLTKRFAKLSINYVFRVSTPDTLQAPMMVREAVERLGVRQLAIFADNTSYGGLGEVQLRQALSVRGLAPCYVARFGLRGRNIAGHLEQARQAGCEGVLIYSFGPSQVELANALARMEWRAPLIGGWTLSMAPFIDNAGPNAEGARMVQTFIPVGDTPVRRAFLEAWQATFHSRRMQSPSSAAQGYDAMRLLAAAMRQSPKLDGASIVAALENLAQPVDGVVTRYVSPFSRVDHEAIRANVPVMGRIERGRVVHAQAPEGRK